MNTGKLVNVTRADGTALNSHNYWLREGKLHLVDYGTGKSYTVLYECIDNVPPATEIQVTPSANENGWNNSDITVNLTATDNEDGSGIREIHYQLSGATQEEQTVAADMVSLTISNEGTTTLTCYSIDNINNQEEEQSVTLKLDKTPPTITATASPEPNANGWNNTDVTVDFSASDNLSGVESVTDPVTVTTEEAEQQVTGEATDMAGNTATASATVSIDKTPPDIMASLSPEPNSNGWNNTDVTITFSASDNLSGIESVTDPVTVTTEGADQEVSGEATDLAGNTATASAVVSIDKTPPSITASTSPEPNIYGWNNTDVTVTFDASDELSGVESVTEPVTVTVEGAEQEVTGEAVDYAGNTATASAIVNIDKTSPAVSITADPGTLWPPNHKMVDVTISGSATDNVSDIASTTFIVIDEYITNSPTLSGFNTTIQLEAWREGSDKDGRIYTILVTAKDKANNEATSSTTVICPHDQGK
jgi:hypothetical protein